MSRDMIDKVSSTSQNPLKSNVERLKELFPEIFTEGRIDFEKLRLIFGGDLQDDTERFSFTWTGRQNAIRILETPSRATLKPEPTESVKFDHARHIFIEGDNLEVLKLLYKTYFNQIKMIYIDPPYNTGGDFVYPDDFVAPLEQYLRLTGQKDETGNLLTSNPETSGRFHSDWLTMMYPRLFLARQLLSDDGLIFISIDDHEIHNLRMIMDEIFGPECFKNCIIFRRGIKSVQAQFETIDALSVGHEYVILYAKSPDTRFKKLYIAREESQPGSWNNHWRGTDRPTMRYELFGITPESGQWRWGKQRSLAAKKNYQRMLNEIDATGDTVTQEQIDEWWSRKSETDGEELDLLRLSTTGKPEHYVPPSDAKLGSDLWVDLSTRGSSEVASLFDGKKVFDNPKPVGLIRRMLEFATDPVEEHLVLDFFAGSGTTAHAVLEQNADDGGNRRFIVVQLAEPTPQKSVARKLGYETIAQICKERIRRVIDNLKEEAGDQSSNGNTFGFRAFHLAQSNYRHWEALPPETDGDEYIRQLELLNDVLGGDFDAQSVLYEILLKEGYDLASHIELETRVTEATVWRINDHRHNQSFFVCLDERIVLDHLKPLRLDTEDLFVCRSVALDDTTAANLALQCRLKTI